MSASDSSHTAFFTALGRYIVSFSLLQHQLEEGIYIVGVKRTGVTDHFVRIFMHNMILEQLRDIFLTLCGEYAASEKGKHLDKKLCTKIMDRIAGVVQDQQRQRNQVVHSFWGHAFWIEGAEGEEVTFVRKKPINRKRTFNPDEEEYTATQLDEMSRANYMIAHFIDEFVICLADGDTHKDKSLASYFEFDNKGDAVFPRGRDRDRFKNLDSAV